MSTEIDELITKLSYEDNSEALEEADKRVTELSESNEEAAKTTEKLSDKQLALAQQLQKAKERTDNLKDEQKNLSAQMRKSGGGTDDQRKKLRQLGVELDANKTQTKKLQTQQARLGLEKRKVGSEARKLAVSQRKLTTATKKAAAATKQQVSGLGKFASRVSTIVSGLVIRDFGRDVIAVFAEAARAIAGLVPAFAAVADETGKTAKGIGVDVEALQRLRFAGERSGVAMATMDKSLAKLTKGLEDARVKGTGPVADAFETLGLSIDAVQRLNTEQRIGAIADAMQKVEDPTTRGALSMTLFGGKAKEMSVLLGEGAEGIKTLGDRATELGGVIDSDAIASAERLADTFLDLDTFTGGLKNTLAIGLAPLIEELTNGMLGWVSANGELIDQGLAAVTDTLSHAFTLVGDVIASIPVEKLILLFVDMTSIIGTLAEQLIKGATDGDGVASTFLDLAVVAADVAAAIIELLGALKSLDSELPELPGLMDAILAVLKLMVRGFVFFSEMLAKLLRLIKPVIEEIGALGSSISETLNPLDSLREMFGGASQSALALATSTSTLNTELDGTASAALAALAALEKLSEQQDKQKEKAKEESETKEAKGKAGAQAQEGQRVRKKKSKDTDKLLANPRGVPSTKFKEISNDFDLSQKQRDKARKILDKRRKSGAKSAADESKGLVTTQVEQQIQARADDAGKRAAARALIQAQRAGEAPDEAAINKLQRDETERVKKSLTARFDETGQLPAGIRSDLNQIAATPGIEAAGGRVAPPVVTITNIRVVGTVFNVDTHVTSSGASAQQIAAATVTGIRGLSQSDVAMAIVNNQTDELR